jgi:hypothetical protein
LEPSLARNFVTLLLPVMVIQILAPSNANLVGTEPAGNCKPVWIAGYHRKRATCKGLYGKP